MLTDVRSNPDFAETVISFEGGDDPLLLMWYVDPALDPMTDKDEISGAVDDLVLEASRTIIRMKDRSQPCIDKLVEFLYVVVVDREYNGWFSGLVPVEGLPAIRNPTELQMRKPRFLADFVREAPPSPRKAVPEESCFWPEAQRRVHQHFGPEGRNLGFYLTVDETGANVWARWDDPTGQEPLVSFVPGLLNVVMELRCLHPPVDRLWITAVAEQGEPLLVGYLPGETIQDPDYATESLEQFMVIGPPELLHPASETPSPTATPSIVSTGPPPQ